MTERDNHKIRGERNRRSIRLRGYDYSRTGMYFVTICTQNRACLFGEMVLNDAGRMIQTVWNEIPDYYPGVDIDAFQIMPNHIHGIIIIVGAGPCACPDAGRTRITGQPRDEHGQPRDEHGQPRDEHGQPRDEHGQPRGVAPTMSLSDVVHRFKTMTTKKYTDGVKQYGWPRFDGKLWQRNYYEHIIRNENELNRIRRYIIDNPEKWQYDRENPHIMPKIQTVREPSQSYGEEPWMI